MPEPISGSKRFGIDILADIHTFYAMIPHYVVVKH